MKTGNSCGAPAHHETQAHLPESRGWRGRQSSRRSHPRCLTGLLLRRRPRGRGDRRLRLLLLLRRSLLPGRRSLLLRRCSRLLQGWQVPRSCLQSLVMQWRAALPAATTPLAAPAGDSGTESLFGKLSAAMLLSSPAGAG